jgi:hypothetical protein
MAQLHHHESPSRHFLQDYVSSDGKQCHDQKQEHNPSTGEKRATTHHDTNPQEHCLHVTCADGKRFKPQVFATLTLRAAEDFFPFHGESIES